MQNDWRTACVALVLLSGGGAAAAADKGDFGLDIEAGSRRLIGGTYHLSRRVAIRPGVFFQSLNAENTPTLLNPAEEAPVYQTEDTVFGGRLEIDTFFRERRGVSPYVGVTVSYSHLNTPYPVANGTNVIFRSGNLNGWSAGALFGAQYAVSPALQLYGHVGLSYSASERFTVNGRRLQSRSWTTSSSTIGVVLYLN